MRPFYSLVKIAPNPASGDNLSIGLILKDENGFRFEFSKNKKNIAKKLLDDKSNIIDYIEEQIVNKLTEVNKASGNSANQDLLNPGKLTESYFAYLNRYCNGILQFSNPAYIDDQIDDVKFGKLFSLLVDNSNKNKSVLLQEENYLLDDFQFRIQTNLIDKVRDRIHVNQKIDSNMIHSIVTPFEMDCIGKNGSLIGAKSLSLLQSKQKTSADINCYMNVIFHLTDKFSNNNDNSFYLISDEPAKIDSKEHRIWENLTKENKFKLINSEECDLIATKIEEKNAKKFLQLN